MKRTFPPAGSVTLVLTIVLFAAVAGASRPGVSAAEDAPKGTVWVVNRDLGELAIFDAGTGDLLKKLAVGRGAHDICISEQTGNAYITAETDNMVTVVDTGTLAMHSIPVGPLPHHIEPSNDGHTIYVSLASHPPTVGTAALYAVIDTSDDSVTYLTSSGDAAARPHAISPTLDGDKLYIAHDTGNQVTAIDTATGSVDFTILGIPRAEESIPSRFGDLLWVTARGDNTVKRIDLASHTVTFVPIGAQPESIMLTPNELTLVVSLRGMPASLGFVDTQTMSPLGLVQIGPAGSAGDLAVMTTNGHHVFATYDNGNLGTGGVAVVDVRTRVVVGSWAYPGTGRPHGVWYSKKQARF
jgi:DNA-binding beta-propeller fold protein YncE